MFLLLAGRRATEVDGRLEQMAGQLRGGEGAPRLWRSPERDGGAASLAPGFVPEDAFDRQPLLDGKRVFVCQARLDNRGELLRRLGLGPDLADSDLLAAAYDRLGERCVHE